MSTDDLVTRVAEAIAAWDHAEGLRDTAIPNAAHHGRARAVLAAIGDRLKPEGAGHDEYERSKTEAYKLMVDLDRCPHGRHEGDSCAGWRPDRPQGGCEGGWSLGNPHIQPGRVIAYDLGARPYAMPGRGDRHHRTAWIAAGGEIDG